MRAAWSTDPAAWFTQLVAFAMEGFYADPGNGGNKGEISWKMIGYDPGSAAQMADVTELEPVDVVVVGAGAGGGVVAWSRLEAGKRVLLLERGRAICASPRWPRDHLRNHRLSLYGHNTGPDLDGNPRVFVRPRRRRARGAADRMGLPQQRRRGRRRHAASTAGRRGASCPGLPHGLHYGVPEGSSLADWPICYDDLAPYYERAEWEIGVAGDGRPI